MGLEAKKCQHYLPNCRYRTNQPHRFQANLRNLIEIAAEYQATCPSCMQRKSAALYCKQPMRLYFPKDAGTGSFSLLPQAVHVGAYRGGILPKRKKAHESGCEFTKNTTPNHISMPRSYSERVINMSCAEKYGFLQLCRAKCILESRILHM